MLRKLTLALALTLSLVLGTCPSSVRAGPVQMFSNNGVTTLASPITSPSAVTLTVASSTAFPSLSGGNWFIATLEHLVSGIVTAQEVVKVTATPSNTWTIVRAQEGTSGLTWLTGDTIALLPTAGGLAQFVQPAQAQTGSYNYAVDTGGSANNYVVALTPAVTAHVAGMPILFKAAHGNTGGSVFNDGAGAVTIVRQDGSTLQGGEITAGCQCEVVYDGTNFQLTASIGNAVLRNPAGGSVQTVTGPIQIASSGSYLELFNSASAANNGAWLLQTFPTSISLTAYLDNLSAGNAGFTINRSGDTITSLAFGGAFQTGATQTTGDSSTRLATTAFVAATLAASPALGGTPTAATAAPGTNTTQIASTAFVQAASALIAATGTGTTNGSMKIPVTGAPNGAYIVKWGFHTPGTNAGAGLETIVITGSGGAFLNHMYFAAAFSNRTTFGTVGTGATLQSSLSTTQFQATVDQDASGNRSALWVAIGD